MGTNQSRDQRLNQEWNNQDHPEEYASSYLSNTLTLEADDIPIEYRFNFCIFVYRIIS
jgi:3-phenylpropionate/cinnamic acid dioxygenase small subunit